jgi:hypothetical protein
MYDPRRHCWCQLVMLLIIKRLKDKALMVRNDSDINTIGKFFYYESYIGLVVK